MITSAFFTAKYSIIFLLFCVLYMS